ncbi:MAG: VWA domain-containing protein [Candidatus Marinimicrobia bacterium]|nr:VWA domain-containing protein [Candidatus Neomarinimicrobiota bacterium]
MKYRIFITTLLLVTSIFADGLLMPADEDYPKDFLRNRMTRINININGLIAETAIYQEFVNESYDSTDAVFSYPLPDEAKATKFLYWYNDIVYEAVLKVKEQAVNPGHGESDLAARVTKYIGNNGIKILLKGIKAQEIQRTELHYISTMDFNEGKCLQEIPLNTGDFVTQPYDLLEMNVHVKSEAPITGYDIPNFPGFVRLSESEKELKLQLTEPKFHPNQNITFEYSISQQDLAVDFFSVNNDTADGHFGLFVKPALDVSADSLFQKRIIFLLSTSWDMYGVKLEESIESISDMLDKLDSEDEFNIMAFTTSVHKCYNECQKASPANITNAKSWLASRYASSGSDMDYALKQALSQINDDEFNNALVVFTGGRSLVDPGEVFDYNTHKTGIFPVGLGDDLSYAQLEMTAAENFGFVTYIDDNDNRYHKIDQLWGRISRPVLKDVVMEYGGATTLTDMNPAKIPSYYSGSYFFTTGRYDLPGNVPLSIGGNSVNGYKSYDSILNFTSKNDTCKFIEKFWAKSMIDRIEWEIEIYGETPELKQQLIDLSLNYNIRCIYTAYVADYENVFTAIDGKGKVQVAESYIAGNYPNPFNPTTNFRIYINSQLYAGVKLLKIFDLRGRLVAVIDISHLQTGWHTVPFNACDAYGNQLPSGVYIAALQIGDRIMNTMKINLMK